MAPPPTAHEAEGLACAVMAFRAAVTMGVTKRIHVRCLCARLRWAVGTVCRPLRALRIMYGR